MDQKAEARARDRERKARRRRADGVPIRAPNGYNIDRDWREPRARHRPRYEPNGLGEGAGSSTPAIETSVREASPPRRTTATMTSEAAGRGRSATATTSREAIVISSDDDVDEPLDSIAPRPEPARSSETVASTVPRPPSRQSARPPLGEVETNVTSFDGTSVVYSRTTIRFQKKFD